MKAYKWLGPQELLELTLLATNVKIFFDMPRRYAIIGADAAWLTMALSGLTACAVFFLVGLALERTPGLGLPELAKDSLGRIGGTIYQLVIALYFVAMASMTSRLLAETIVMTAIPQVPISIIVLSTLAFAVFAAYRGVNALAKSCYVALPFLAAGVALLLLMSVFNWRLNNMFPLLGFGARRTLLGGVWTAGTLGDAVILSVLAGTLQIGVPRLSLMLKAVGFSAALQVIVILSIGMIFPYPVSAELALPYYMASRTISLGFFLQRLEALFLVSWALSVVLNIAIYFVACLRLYQQVFSIPDSTPLTLPLAGIVFAAALMPGSYMEASDTTWRWLWVNGGVLTLVLPTLIALISLWRNRRASGTQAKEDIA